MVIAMKILNTLIQNNSLNTVIQSTCYDVVFVVELSPEDHVQFSL